MPNVNGRRAGRVDLSASTLQSAAAATGNGTAYTVDANTEEIFVRAVGATVPSMTVVFEYSNDGGSTWKNAFLSDLLNVALGTGLNVLAIAATTPLEYRWVPPPGATTFRARVSIYATGTVTVTLTERRWA